MSEEQGYNGWKNYPTWAVNLWLNNDEGTQEAALDVTRSAVWERGTGNASKRLAVADALKAWITDGIADEGHNPFQQEASVYTDLLGWAMDSVDWFETADAFIEMCEEIHA